MVRIFKTIEGAIHEIQEPQEDCWIAMTNPTATEIFEMSERFGIEVDDLRAPLDEEERSRIEVEDNYTLILVDVPMIEERNDKDWYGTLPSINRVSTWVSSRHTVKIIFLVTIIPRGIVPYQSLSLRSSIIGTSTRISV